jgi:hypothetical protein
VDLKAHPVPESVLEMLGVPGRLDHLTGRGVHRAHLRAGLDRLDPGPLRLSDELVDIALPSGRLTDRNGTGHVRVVPAVQRAEVHGHEVAAAQRPFGGHVVRDGAVRAARHDRVERGPVRPQLGHAVVDERREGSFGQTWTDLGQDISDGLRADPAGGRQQLKLARILDRP